MSDVGRGARAAGRASVGGLFANAASLFPTRTALDDGVETLSYAELDRRVNQAANALAAQGVRPGDRVALLAENSLEYVVLMLACAKAGVILACQNWRLTAGELAHCLRLVEPSLVIGSQRYAELLTGVDAPLGVAVLESDFRVWQDAASPGPPGTEVDPEDPLLILYTSGTTGLPKGAVISHRAEIARNMVLRGEFGLDPGDTFVCWTPLYHMGGADHALGTLMVGGKVIVVDGFDAQRLADLTATERLGWLVVMPGATDRMLEALRAQTRPVVGVRVCGVMADLIPRHHILELTSRLGAPFVNTFGSTETGSPPASAGLLAAGELPETLSKRQSMFCEVRLVDPQDRDVPDGVPGELAMRGPTLFSGYWGDEETNARDFRGGWFHMGDVFVRNPDATLDFVDRAKYLIKSGGENIYPAEIERVLLADPRVSDAAVVRRADPRWGEVPVAFVAREDAGLDEAAVRALCRDGLAGYKQPKAIHFIGYDDFPRSASGKIQRHELERRLDGGPGEDLCGR